MKKFFLIASIITTFSLPAFAKGTAETYATGLYGDTTNAAASSLYIQQDNIPNKGKIEQNNAFESKPAVEGRASHLEARWFFFNPFTARWFC